MHTIKKDTLNAPDIFIERISRLEDPNFFTCTWKRDPQAATYGGYPDRLDPRLENLIRQRYPEGLFLHQTQAIISILEGNNTLITTGTSSGKSLCYQIPIINELLSNEKSTSLLLFPTKALAEDQKYQLLEIANLLINADKEKICIATYDGDTPKAKRITIRNSINLLLTNPDMLHFGMLPYHALWSRFFEHLKYIVIDEAHSYRGIFGSHIANVIRRMKRILQYYGAKPQFILTSATLSNAEEFTTQLTGENFDYISRDYSFQESRQFIFINPPVVNQQLGIRKGLIEQTIEISKTALKEGLQSILFSRSRKTVEWTLRKLNEIVDSSRDYQLHGYRSGYLKKERRIIENGLRSGSVQLVVSTNALEMGIDMGKVDLTILMGFPGSIASFYQQSGRAGRKGRNSISILIASSSPMDQYVIRHCDYIKNGFPEFALIDPDNPLLLLEHIKCALCELPFYEKEFYGKLESSELLDFLNIIMLSGQAVEKNQKYFWLSDVRPTENVSLRNIPGNPIIIRLISAEVSQAIGEIDYQSAIRMVHPGAVYIHNGISYIVDRLDLENHIAWVSPHDGNFYTEQRSESTITLDQRIKNQAYNNYAKAFGDLHIMSRVTGYKRIDWDTGIDLGNYSLEDLPETNLFTKGTWLSFSERAISILHKKGQWQNDINRYGKDWDKIRLSIIERDKNICQNCGNLFPSKMLHVHHKIPFKNFDDKILANQPSNLTILCPSCHRIAEQNVRMRSGLSALAYLMGNLAPLKLLCDTNDIGYFSDTLSPLEDRQPVIVFYDLFPGGIGLSAKLYEIIEDILIQSLEVIDHCECKDGCPSCVGPAGENGIGGKIQAKAMIELIINKSNL